MFLKKPAPGVVQYFSENLSPIKNLRSQIALAAMVLKITSGLKIFQEIHPWGCPVTLTHW